MGVVHVNEQRLKKLKIRRIISVVIYLSIVIPTVFTARFGFISGELNIIITITSLALFLIYFNLILQKQIRNCFYEDEQENQ